MIANTTKRIGLQSQNKLRMLSAARRAQFATAAYEGEGKTVVRVINQEQDLGLMIDTYATYGFRLNNGITVLGPMAIFPRTVMSWQVLQTDQITEESLRLFRLLEPKVDLLVVGLESEDRSRHHRVFRAARLNRLNVEILPTEHACATFNFLNAEGRSVAAALIPPLKLSMNEDDVMHTRMHYDDVFHSTLH